MTKNADFKRRVRARMARTGESYTAARAQLQRSEEPPTSELDYPARAGMTDEAVQAKTGKTWKEWSDALDGAGARQLDHTEIARSIGEHWPEIGAWWAQTVTVGYERIHGKRSAGQMPGGTFTANKSKTFARPVTALYQAVREAAWLRDAEITTDRSPASLRAKLGDGTRLAVTFTDKGPAKSSLAIQHSQLATAADRDASKALWAERLAAL